jgi:hypothetical protein
VSRSGPTQEIWPELGQLVERMDAVVGEADLPRTRETTVVPRLPPPMRPASEIEWWGERNGHRLKRPWPAGRRPAIE